MTHLEQRYCDFLEQQLQGYNQRQSIEQLFRLKVISVKAVETLAIRQHIEEVIRGGGQIGSALIASANRFCCSYEKVRNIFYQR